jgi:hypothetical protein
VIILVDLPTIAYFLFFRSRSLIRSTGNNFTVRSASSILNSSTARSIRSSIRGSSLVLDELVPVLDRPALDLAALLAFDLPLPKLILGSFYPIGSRNIIR